MRSAVTQWVALTGAAVVAVVAVPALAAVVHTIAMTRAIIEAHYVYIHQ